MLDLVKCCNCGFAGTVKMGAEECPECKMIGALAWQDDDNPEIAE
jgi:predicted Zn-ribbon and HTH transcriptional regulator